MEGLRLKRYRDKINYVITSINLINSNPRNELEKRGIFYSLQTSIEAVIDLIAMSVKDAGIPIEEDNQNITQFIKISGIDTTLGEKLKKANGMRNIIVHRYNQIEEEIILESVNDIKNLLLEFIERIERFIDEISKH